MPDPTEFNQMYTLLATERTRLGILLPQANLHGGPDDAAMKINELGEDRGRLRP